MEARNRSLPDWFQRVRTNQVALPRFQRFEAWTHRHVAGLLGTALRGLPAGALLVMEVGDEEPFVSRLLSGAPQGQDGAHEYLLDGQQRLTALWRSMTDDYPDRTYFVSAQESDGDSGPMVVSHARWESNGRRYPLWAGDPQQVWSRKLIPVSLLRPDLDADQELSRWAEVATGGDAHATLGLFKTAAGYRDKFKEFNLPFLMLPRTTSRDTALEVFVRMNTSAQPLKTYDIVVAQVEAGTGQSLHDLVAELRYHAPDLEQYIAPEQAFLSAGALLMDQEPRRSSMLGRRFADGLVGNWDRIVRGSVRAAAFLNDEGVFDNQRLPTEPVIPLMVALWADAPDGLDAEGNARQILRQLLWSGFLTERYERSTNSRVLADYRSVSARLKGEDQGLPRVFDRESYPLPTVEELVVAGWPKKRDRLGRACLLLSLRGGGLDFADGSPATRESLKRREYHHIFPVAVLERQQVESGQIHRALNCALVTWKTNRNISAKTPEQYIQQRVDATSLREPEILRRLESHRIDYDSLCSGDYLRFLRARAEALLPDMGQLTHAE